MICFGCNSAIQFGPAYSDGGLGPFCARCRRERGGSDWSTWIEHGKQDLDQQPIAKRPKKKQGTTLRKRAAQCCREMGLGRKFQVRFKPMKGKGDS